MKRKKPPVALISVLVVAVLGLAIVSKGFSFYNQSPEEQQKQLQQEAMERAQANATPSKNDQKVDSTGEAKALKDSIKAGTPSTASIRAKVPGQGGLKTTVPTVVMPDETVQKPKPNTAAPSGQWYDKN
jgi:type II secretory pathway pseudopilin PulG